MSNETKTRKRYQCRGGVRGRCGVDHRTLSGAARCLARDQRYCRSVGGYSDRSIYLVDQTREAGYWAEGNAEMIDWQEYEERA